MTENSEALAAEAAGESVKDKIKAAREKLAAVRAAREAELAPEREARELARLERELRDEDAIAAAQAKHGEKGIEVIRTDLGVVIVKPANPLKFNKYQDEGKTDTFSMMALVVQGPLVHPKTSEFEKICEALPLTLLRTVDAVFLLAGAQQRDISGK